MNRSKIKSTLLQALTSAGALIKSGSKKPFSIKKKGELNLVTAIDLAAEKKILSIIRGAFPDHSVLTEESSPTGISSSRWIIDPLDGTTNFAHRFPVSCTSIAYEENGKVLMGGVYDPFRDELFFAEFGKGAFLNGKRLRVSKIRALSESLVCTGFPYDRKQHMDEYLPIFKDFKMRVQGLRRLGAAALDLCYVACGRFDGYWEVKLNSWDKAAGMLMIKEAGGKTTNFSGQPLTLGDTQNLASNGLLHTEMLSVLKNHRSAGRS